MLPASDKSASPEATVDRQQPKSNSYPLRLSGPLQGQKSLFRVPIDRSPRVGSPGSDHSSEQAYHARRPHRKSRSGCLQCKKKRVKCDEAQPHCVRCQKHGIDCSYTVDQPRSNHKKGVISQFIEKKPGLISPDPTGHSICLIAVARKLDEFVQANSPLHDGVRSLQCFHQNTNPIMKADKRAQILPEQKILQLAFDSPFLMHSIIAFSTSHLRRLLPEDSTYKVAEAYHWQQAINQYTREISSAVGPHNMDALFSTCLLMTVHSFALEKYNPRSSFVFSNDPESLNWLALQGGLRHLLGLAKPWISHSIWHGTFMVFQDDDDNRPGRVDLPPELADICGIEDTTAMETNPYLWPLRLLTPLLLIERSKKNFPKFASFMSCLLPEYYEQLMKKDPPALIILSWWLALMDSVNLWWVEKRVRSECAAICMFLEDSEDPRILNLLEFPAETCGYLLKLVQKRTARCWEIDN